MKGGVIIRKQLLLLILVFSLILASFCPISARPENSTWDTYSNSTNPNSGLFPIKNNTIYNISHTVCIITPERENVFVSLDQPSTNITPVILNFTNVDEAGNSSVTMLDSAPEIPSNFTLTEDPVFLEINTTAKYSGSILVAVNYTNLNYKNESALRLLHYDNGTWIDITTSIDTVNKMIYGLTNSFSPFAIISAVINDLVIPENQNGNQNNENLPTQNNQNIYVTTSNIVHAASEITTTVTVGMQETGIPIPLLVIAILMVFSGLIGTKKN